MLSASKRGEAIRIQPDEFIKKVLEGEKDFSRLIMENLDNSRIYLSMYDGFRDMNKYLSACENQGIQPLIINNAVFCKVDAEGICLPGAEAEGIEIEFSKFSSANLRGANLKNSKIVGVSLSGADLSDANLQHSLLTPFIEGHECYAHQETSLYGANLERADLSGSKICSVDFGQAKLNNAKLKGAVIYGIRGFISEVPSFILGRVNFRRAELEEADLSDSVIYGARFDRAKLRGADFSNSNLSLVYLTSRRLDEKETNRTDARGAKFKKAVITFSDFAYSDLSGSDLTCAIVYEFDTYMAIFKDAALNVETVQRSPKFESRLNRLKIPYENWGQIPEINKDSIINYRPSYK